MIPTILNKILEELNKESPKLDYIRGMVEVLLASEQPRSLVVDLPKSFSDTGILNPKITSDQEILDARARAAIETVKSMSTEE